MSRANRSSCLDRDIHRAYGLRFPLDQGTVDWDEVRRVRTIILRLRQDHPVPGDQHRGEPYRVERDPWMLWGDYG